MLKRLGALVLGVALALPLVAGQLPAAKAVEPARDVQVLQQGVATMVYGPYSSYWKAKKVSDYLKSCGYYTKIVHKEDGYYYVYAW